MTTYKKMKCYNLMTGEFVGYLGTHDNYLTLTDADGAATFVWSSEGADLYLEKETQPNDRYLGLAERDYAGWGLKGGWRNPVIFNSDGSISLKDEPRRKLYGPISKISANYIAFTEAGDSNQNVLKFELQS